MRQRFLRHNQITPANPRLLYAITNFKLCQSEYIFSLSCKQGIQLLSKTKISDTSHEYQGHPFTRSRGLLPLSSGAGSPSDAIELRRRITRRTSRPPCLACRFCMARKSATAPFHPPLGHEGDAGHIRHHGYERKRGHGNTAIPGPASRPHGLSVTSESANRRLIAPTTVRPAPRRALDERGWQIHASRRRRCANLSYR
jgi:hypothetical protein